MLNVICVLRSGGIYDASWVQKLRDGVARNLTVDHRFVCLSDAPVPCEREPLMFDWPGWWAKLELFRPGIITEPTLYLDLDTLIVANIDALANIPNDFSMLRNFGRTSYIGSGVMWFRERAPGGVYDRFLEDPRGVMDRYAVDTAKGAHFGDQAHIYDAVGDAQIGRLQDAAPGLIHCYPHTFDGDVVPEGCGLVCFKGKVKPPAALHHAWAEAAWT